MLSITSARQSDYDVLATTITGKFFINLCAASSGDRRLARSLNLCYRYADGLIVFNNKKLIDPVKDTCQNDVPIYTNKAVEIELKYTLKRLVDSMTKQITWMAALN